jgi:hypothetical protein
VVLAGGGAGYGASKELAGKIESVTVYRGQALVTRVLEVDSAQGPMELTVTDLPAQVLPESLYASGSRDVAIRAVRFRTRAVSNEPREDIRKIQEQIEQAQAELAVLKGQEDLISQKKQYLDKLENFSTGKSGENLDKGTLDVEALIKLSDYLFKQRAALVEQRTQLSQEMSKVQEKLELLGRQLRQLTSGTTKTVREAMIFLDKPRGNATIRLSYVVGGATWQPTYTVRCAGRDEKIELEYNALIQQMSGENWDGVKLTLSTASPSMIASAPLLTPLWVTLRGGPANSQANMQGAPGQKGYAMQQTENQWRLNRAVQQRGQAKASNWQQDWALNSVANEMQVLEFNAEPEAIRQNRMTDLISEVLSVSYELDAAISLPSRNDQQMVRISRLDMAGDFYYLSIPVLTPYVYQQADLVNTSEIALLAGPVNTYLDGQFTGSDRIPMVAKGQRFTLGFGIDSQLRVRRELAAKKESTQGGNRRLDFTYAFQVSNFKDKAVEMRLLDRLPEAPSADIQVELGEMSQPLSENELYRKTLRKSGILMWQIEVPAGAAGAEAKTLEYSYSMEFDKNMSVTEPSPQQLQQEQEEFRRKLDNLKMMNK